MLRLTLLEILDDIARRFHGELLYVTYPFSSCNALCKYLINIPSLLLLVSYFEYTANANHVISSPRPPGTTRALPALKRGVTIPLHDDLLQPASSLFIL